MARFTSPVLIAAVLAAAVPLATMAGTDPAASGGSKAVDVAAVQPDRTPHPTTRPATNVSFHSSRSAPAADVPVAPWE